MSMRLIKRLQLLMGTPFKVYLGLAGFAPWARPANQSIPHLIFSNKVRRCIEGAGFLIGGVRHMKL